jgi:hypothetical protein
VITNNPDNPKWQSNSANLPGYTNTRFLTLQVRAFDNESPNGDPASFKIWGTDLDADANNAAPFIAAYQGVANYVDFDSEPSFNYAVNTNYFNVLTTAGEGPKTFSVVFYDSDGNPSRTQNMTVIFDQTGPSVVSLNNTSTLGVPGYTAQTQKLNADWAGTDNLSSIYRYNYKVYERQANYPVSPDVLLTTPISGVNLIRGNTAFPNLNNAANQVNLQIAQTLKTNGEQYYFVVQAVDLAGNKSTAVSSNTMLVDGFTNIPELPVFNYFSGIVLNQPIMDVDFYDG